MKFALKAVVLPTLLLASSHALALTYTQYTDRAAFESAAGVVSKEDFNAEATGAFTTRAFTDFTVYNMDTANVDTSIEAGSGDTNVNGSNYLKMFSRQYPDGMDLEFTEPVTALGFDWRNTDTSGDDARLVVIVDGAEFVFGVDQGTGFFGIIASDGAFGRVKFNDTAGDGGYLQSLGIDDITYNGADPGTTATFRVTKQFEDNSTGDVEVTITCDAGLPLQQSFTISGGGTGVNFVVTELPTSGADCEVVETSGADNYTPSYNNGTATSSTSCAYTGVAYGANTCVITNMADDATLDVTSAWIVGDENEDIVDMTANLQVRCSVDFDGALNDGLYYRDYTLVGEVATATVTGIGTHMPNDGNWCYVEVTGSVPSGVMITNGCGTQASPIDLSAGEEAECTVEYSIFFEGIPTLSQYGMALMALLMLGVGLLGFRRFA